MKQYWYFPLGVVGFLLIGGSLAWLKGSPLGSRAKNAAVALQTTGTPTIGLPVASPTVITIGTTTPVLFTVQISDTRLIPDSVNLLRLNPNGSTTTLGVMRDNGASGDAIAKDNIYSLHVNLRETTLGQVRFQASAAFRGFLTRVLSDKTIVSVWTVFNQPTVPFRIAYPSNVVSEYNPRTGDLRLQNLSNNLNNDDKEILSASDYFIEIFTLPRTTDYSGRITAAEPVMLPNGQIGIRGPREWEEYSPFPGIDMYVSFGGRIYVVAGTYDGLTQATASTIKAIQEQFVPF